MFLSLPPRFTVSTGFPADGGLKAYSPHWRVFVTAFPKASGTHLISRGPGDGADSNRCLDDRDVLADLAVIEGRA